MLTLFMKYILSTLIIFGFTFSQSHANHFIYPDKCGFHSPNESEIILENNIERWLIKNSDYSNRNTLNIPIAMAYVPIKLSQLETKISVNIRGKLYSAEIVKKPFYKKADIS